MERSPLGRLPRELRDKIYDLAVVHEDGIDIKPDRRQGKVVPRVASSNNTTLALAMTCRQLHRETIGLYYERNCFYFPFSSSGVELLKTFLTSLKPDHYSRLRHIVFQALDMRFNKPGIPEKHGTTSRWMEIVRGLRGNFGTMLPGPISIGGCFKYKHASSISCPLGKFYVSLDANDLPGSMELNQQAAGNLRRQLIHYWGEAPPEMDRLYVWMASFAQVLERECAEDTVYIDEDGGGEDSGSGDTNGDTGDVVELDENGNEDEDKEMHGNEDNENRDTYGWASDSDDDEDVEDGKMVPGLSLGDHFWKKATGLRIQ